jgi:hypothetical protein
VPTPPQPVADLLAALERALRALGVRWFLFGAQAAVLYGAARLSADVDVTVDLGVRSLSDIAAALAAEFEPRVTDPVQFGTETHVMPYVHRASRMPLDVVIAGPGLEEQFFAGAHVQIVGDVRVPVVSAEDLVAMKILAGRPTDLEDATAVVRTRRAQIDVERIRGTLRALEAALARRDLLVVFDGMVR